MEEWTEDVWMKSLDQGGKGGLFLYTPMCGTCHVAERMLKITLEMFPDITVGKLNLNFYPDLATRFKIESVPCLILYNDGTLLKQLYAFHSVPYLRKRFMKAHYFSRWDEMNQLH